MGDIRLDIKPTPFDTRNGARLKCGAASNAMIIAETQSEKKNKDWSKDLSEFVCFFSFHLSS